VGKGAIQIYWPLTALIKTFIETETLKMPFVALNDTDAHDQPKSLLHDWALLSLLKPYLFNKRKALLISILIIPLLSVTQLLQPKLFQLTLDDLLLKNSHHDHFLMMSFLFLALVLIHYGLRYLQMWLAQYMGQSIVLALRSDLFSHLQKLSVKFYNTTPFGKLITRVSADVENINEIFSQGGLAMLADLLMITGILVAMWLMQAQLALIVLAFVPVIFLTIRFFRNTSRRYYNKLRRVTAELNGHLQESLSGMDVIQSLNQIEPNTQAFETLSNTFQRTSIQSVVIDSAFTATIELLSLLTLFVMLGTLDVFHSFSVSLGTLVAFVQYTQMLYEPLEELSDKFTVLQSSLASIDKIDELLKTPIEITSPQYPVMIEDRLQDITFEDVTFGYNEESTILKAFNLVIPAGQRLAIVGATGAGKSTLIKLLNRQYDVQAGRITLGGIDIRDYALSDLRQQMTLISQEDFLFSRSLLENITFQSHLTPEASEKLWDILERLDMMALVKRLPEGLNTLLAERGRTLSQGERQLVVFARALYHAKKILILDEATSAIDPATEQRIQLALNTLMEGRTAIIIAHRLSTIRQVDRVLHIA
jgi:ATP-binding cassette, subfamily B, multidrug efflux pump